MSLLLPTDMYYPLIFCYPLDVHWTLNYHTLTIIDHIVVALHPSNFFTKELHYFLAMCNSCNVSRVDG